MAETVHPLSDLPLPTLGAPSPHLAGTEFELRLLYYAAEPEDSLVTIHFIGTYAMRWGPPNDERRGELGLAKLNRPSEIRGSTWLAGLIRAGQLESGGEEDCGLSHFCLPFHDSTLDVAADGYTFERRRAPIHEEFPDLARKLVK